MNTDLLGMKLDALAKLQKIQIEMLRAIASQGLGPYGNSVVDKAEKLLYCAELAINCAFPNLDIKASIRNRT